MIWDDNLNQSSQCIKNTMNDYVVIDQNWKPIRGSFQPNILYLCKSPKFVTYSALSYCVSIESAHMIACSIVRQNYRLHTNCELQFIEQLLNPSYELNKVFDYIFLYNYSSFNIFQLRNLFYY
jgi:hypothetical protein